MQPWQGENYWWGGKADQANGMMTTAAPIAIPAGGASLSFDLAYDIEDAMGLPVGAGVGGWHHLEDPDQRQHHVHPRPELDRRAVRVPGRSVCGGDRRLHRLQRRASRRPDTETFDLAAFAGKSIWLRFWYMTDWGTTYEGPFVDNVKVVAGADHALRG